MSKINVNNLKNEPALILFNVKFLGNKEWVDPTGQGAKTKGSRFVRLLVRFKLSLCSSRITTTYKPKKGFFELSHRPPNHCAVSHFKLVFRETRIFQRFARSTVLARGGEAGCRLSARRSFLRMKMTGVTS